MFAGIKFILLLCIVLCSSLSSGRVSTITLLIDSFLPKPIINGHKLSLQQDAYSIYPTVYLPQINLSFSKLLYEEMVAHKTENSAMISRNNKKYVYHLDLYIFIALIVEIAQFSA